MIDIHIEIAIMPLQSKSSTNRHFFLKHWHPSLQNSGGIFFNGTCINVKNKVKVCLILTKNYELKFKVKLNYWQSENDFWNVQYVFIICEFETEI